MFSMKRRIKVPGIISTVFQSSNTRSPDNRRAGSKPGEGAHGGALPLALIVDDSADDRWMMGRSFARAGFQVVEAASGEEVICAFKKHSPQVVVLDVLMPYTGGLSACQMLRQQPGGERLLIVVVSGLGDAGTRHRALAAGASEFLPKPQVGQDYATLVQRVYELSCSQARFGDGTSLYPANASLQTG